MKLAKLHKSSVKPNKNKSIGISEKSPQSTIGKTSTTAASTNAFLDPDTTQIPSPKSLKKHRVSFSEIDNNEIISNPSFSESKNASFFRSEDEFEDLPWSSSSSFSFNSTNQRRNSAPNFHESRKRQELNSVSGQRSSSVGEVPDIDLNKCLVVALYDFKARTTDDLSFSKGDSLEVMRNVASDWWLAWDVNGKVGYIPSNFVAELEDVETESWYFGNISRHEAERHLLTYPNRHGSYLIRLSESRNMEYSLSVRCEDAVKHYRIQYSEKGWFYVSRQKIFPTLKNLVEYYHLYLSGMCCKFEAPCINVNRLEPEILEGEWISPHSTLDTWEIQRNQIELTKKLGTGNFGEVHKGVWNKTTEIAVKTLKRNTTTEWEFLAEAQVMKKLRHPKLIQLYGVCTECEPFYIVTEYMKFGSLDKYLGKYRHSISLMDKLRVCAQVASGMAYLESQNFIHRDLAARNVLVGERLTCKVADFGLSRILQENEYFAIEGSRFPIKWTAPEALFYNRFSVKSDVWSYGILLTEVFTNGGFPYPDLTNQQVVLKINEGYRMNRPRNCPKEIYALMLKCWDADPHLRPSFQTLLQTMESFCLVQHKSNKFTGNMVLI